MMKNEILSLDLSSNQTKDIVKLSFDFEIKKFPKELEEDENFIYPDEFFMVNLGEKEKFTSDYVYQSKLTLFKDNDKFNFGGYTPDWNRKSDILKDKNLNTAFDPSLKYHVELTFSKYRCYIDINYGEIVSNYGNARIDVSDAKFFVRKGFEVLISNVYFYDTDDTQHVIDDTLKKMIDNKIFQNYMYYHVDDYGVYFDRMNIIQNIKCTTRNSGQRSISTMIDMYTNTKKIGIEYSITDIEINEYPYQFGFFVNRKKIETEVRKSKKFENTYIEFNVPEEFGENNRVTIVLPNNMTVVVKKVIVDDNAIIYPVKKKMSILLLGDSISECSECIDAASSFPIQISLAFNAYIYNQAISGRTFNDYNVLGDYYIKPDYILIANGTNSYCMGTAVKSKAIETLDNDMKGVLKDIETHFKNVPIIGLLPLWRSDEIGPNFTLKDISRKMSEVYSRYKNVKTIDCYDFIPHRLEYFSNGELMLHPSSKGHDVYGKKLIDALTMIFGNIDNSNDQSMADLIVNLSK